MYGSIVESISESINLIQKYICKRHTESEFIDIIKLKINELRIYSQINSDLKRENLEK